MSAPVVRHLKTTASRGRKTRGISSSRAVRQSLSYAKLNSHCTHLKSKIKVEVMENKFARHAILAIILLAVTFVPATSAQQVGTTSKPAKEKANPTTSTPAGSTSNVVDQPNKVVIRVGLTEVSQSEIDFLISNLNPQAQQALTANGRRPLGDEFVKVLLLSQQAQNDHLEANPALRERIELQRNQMLAQAEYEKMSTELKVTPDEIGQYFTSHQSEFETVQVRDFVVRIKPEGAKDDAPGLLAADAKAKAESMRKAVLAGTDLKTVAKDFAAANAVMIDDQARNIKRGQLLPALDKAAFELKEGEVSEVVETPQATVFIQIVSARHVSDQKEVASGIEDKLRQQKLDSALGDLRNKTKVWMDEDYFKAQAEIKAPPKTVPTDAPPKSQP